MAPWKVTLAYNGTGLHGWQIQPGLATVQGLLAEALYRISGEAVLPQGAGRTDAGVHALGQVSSFVLAAPIPPENLQRALNRVLPNGIRVLAAEETDSAFHARHSSCGKLYEYRIFERRASSANTTRPKERVCSPFLAPFVWDCRWPLALAPMQAAAALLEGTHDFTAMAARSAGLHEKAVQSDAPNPVKTIHTATWERAGEELHFRIRGSGFLHHMVRNLVGTMVDIGRGSLALEDLPRILASRDRAQAGPTAPAKGLYLVQVFYEPHPSSLGRDACATGFKSGEPNCLELTS